jgi:predicted TIM-barrel fold metal-dependent hydrolase
VFAAAQETGLPLCAHLGSSSRPVITSLDAPYGVMHAMTPMNLSLACADWLFSDNFRRFPDLKLCLSEGGIGWIPYVLERLDDTYEERLADDLQLPLPPSAYFKRQMAATFQKDVHGVQAMARLAPDNVMWGSDYPHRDGTWPFSQKAIEEQFRDVPAAVAGKILRENVRRIYRIEG